MKGEITPFVSNKYLPFADAFFIQNFRQIPIQIRFQKQHFYFGIKFVFAPQKKYYYQ